MAKLSYYYSLCPIIDRTNLLGVSEDFDCGNVIVTLGRNIAIKYRLLDQKPLFSWRTKDKFTSPVIYYKDKDVYCATFNQFQVRTWKKDEEYLDKLKKLKFNKPIYTLLNCGDRSFIIFQNGFVCPLQKGLEERKELEPDTVIDTTVEQITGTTNISIDGKSHIGIFVNNNEQTYFLWFTFSKDEQISFIKINITSPNLKLNGTAFIEDINQEVALLCLWCDGKLFKYNSQSKSHSEDGKFLGVMDYLSSKQEITIVALNQDYIVFYGADCNEEGASLILFNLQFKLIQSKLSFKMFTSGTRMWSILNNIFLCIGQNLAIVPFKLDTEQLAALVGSHKLKTGDQDVSIVQNLIDTQWCEHKYKKHRVRQGPNEIKSVFNELASQGFSEAVICNELFTNLMDENNLEAISVSIKFFIDIPENVIAMLLNYMLNLESSFFNANPELNKRLESKFPPHLRPIERYQYIDTILQVKYSDVLLIPQIRSNLDLTNVLTLLRYIAYLLSDDGHYLGKHISNSDRILINWCCVLLDANYQKLLLSTDTKILELLSYLKSLIEAHMSCLNELQKASTILNDFKKGVKKDVPASTLAYSIEEIKLY